MLIKLSNNYYINSEKINLILPSIITDNHWIISMDSGDTVELNQAHFDELMACLPTPVEASKIVESKQATETPEIRAYNLMMQALGGSHG